MGAVVFWGPKGGLIERTTHVLGANDSGYAPHPVHSQRHTDRERERDIYIYIYIYIHTYIHTYTHTHTETRTHMAHAALDSESFVRSMSCLTGTLKNLYYISRILDLLIQIPLYRVLILDPFL